VIDGGLTVLSRAPKPASSRLYKRLYRRFEHELPFSGGPPAEVLVAFLEDRGVADVSVEPLMDAALWGRPPRYQRYVVTGRKPLDADLPANA
jgi:hypothetical protein